MKMEGENIPERTIYSKILWWMIKRKLLYYSLSNENGREYHEGTFRLATVRILILA